MNVTVAKGGKFTGTIGAKALSRGLRATRRNPRNDDFLVKCEGMVGRDGALQAIEPFSSTTFTLMALSVITDGFPFPQIFVFTNNIIACGAKTIYEWEGSTFSLQYTAAEEGGVWNAVDFYDYFYLSNGKIAVIKNPASNLYETSTLPYASAICNFNGQVIIGSPDVNGLGVPDGM